ncbi:hypothetical protein [Afipia felis]
MSPQAGRMGQELQVYPVFFLHGTGEKRFRRDPVTALTHPAGKKKSLTRHYQDVTQMNANPLGGFSLNSARPAYYLAAITASPVRSGAA